MIDIGFMLEHPHVFIIGAWIASLTNLVLWVMLLTKLEVEVE